MSHNKEINAVSKRVESPDICCIDFYAPDAPEKFSQSLKTTGFGVLTKHPIDWQLVEDVYDEWRTFLSQEEEK